MAGRLRFGTLPHPAAKARRSPATATSSVPASSAAPCSGSRASRWAKSPRPSRCPSPRTSAWALPSRSRRRRSRAAAAASCSRTACFAQGSTWRTSRRRWPGAASWWSHRRCPTPSGASPLGALGELFLQRADGEASRRRIVEEAIVWLRGQGVVGIGLAGHSRGGVTASQLEGEFCRVNLAGFQPPQVDAREYFSPSVRRAPMLVVCGREDEVCTRPPLSLDYVQQTVREHAPHAETWYPEGVGHFNVLDPRVISRWKDLLGPFGGLAPAADPSVAKQVGDRIADFLDKHVPG
mmetsp:Transcript_32507/g.107145  ORF Transcript_32507/g.107145 Transcript_32507/m.107145 type:complete len:294 (-) Transcript_32507:176-1057(-)